ncbi:AraC family transcriptional regulator ligand-binding domain-containing protein [Acinetobacter sp. VNK23]|uniref:AraC family transcriptional regulator n=1 Tax=Acinetobacter thutiue TaxID=2998078 RepID=UPI002578B1AF|nr:AraC family transcriptional regulator [Acinetobacter thutiue]MDM1022192.1 AraC family transcriptional regulator ligand-binding domain-containing protein [Acinetobacter thutiue]
MSFECDYCFIPAHHQLSILIDLAASHEVDHHVLLRGSGLFIEDIFSGHKLINQQQFQHILKNAEQYFRNQDISFLFGQRSLTTPFNDAIKAMLYSSSLDDALNRYLTFFASVSPWLCPRIMYSSDQIHLYWLDENKIDNRFFIESAMSAIQALSRQLYQSKLPWTFEFNFNEPDYIEQYWTHLGGDLTFNRPMNMMSLPSHFIHEPLPGASATLATISHQQALQYMSAQHLQQSFLLSVHQYLMQNIQNNIQLEHTAEHFQMSSATLKRKLKKHQTHFQAQLDQSRLHTAIHLYRVHGFKTEQISQYLQINDTTNFRRAFKRWSGLTVQAAQS